MSHIDAEQNSPLFILANSCIMRVLNRKLGASAPPCMEVSALIAYIKGTAADMTETSVILENSGIGFEIFMPQGALAQIRIGKEYKLHTYFHVKEDDMQLYGFLAKDDLQVFRLLLQVNGIGPKGALGVLSGLTADELRFAILSDDVKTISKAPVIGKKTAQKLILELKDKLNLQDAFEKKYENTAQENVMSDSVTDAKKEAVEALVALGYSSTDALRAVKRAEISEEADVETVLKAALKHI